MSFYERLMAQTESARQQFLATPFLRDGVAGNINHTSYIAFLTEAYHHVRHTVPLLMACGARLPTRLEWLRNAVAEYIEEELGHQEWILNDIAAAGGDAQRVREGVPSLATELMVAYAYDRVNRLDAVGFFGMVFVLEGTSVKLATPAAEAIQQALGLPTAAFSYLLSHGSLDIKHIDFFKNLMNRLDEPHDQAEVTHVARTIYRLYGDIFRGLPHQTLHNDRKSA